MDYDKEKAHACGQTAPCVGSGCLEKGYITRDQLTIMTTIIEPYKAMGGDGLADSIMDRCRSLPIRTEKEMTVSEIQAGR